MARRKPGALIALEREILDAALSLRRSGSATFHGFALAQHLRERSDSRSLTAHGTLYKALGRLEEFGFLRSAWDAQPVDGRPRRRLYELTAEGSVLAGQALVGRVGEAADGRGAGDPHGLEGPAPRVTPEPA